MTRRFRKLGARKYRGWKKWKKGDWLVGKLTGGTFEDKYGNTGYDLELIEASFKDFDEGDIVSLNHCGGFSNAIKGLPPGAVIQVTYDIYDKLDNPKSPYHGKETHFVEVSVDEDSLLNAGHTSNRKEEDLSQVEDYDL